VWQVAHVSTKPNTADDEPIDLNAPQFIAQDVAVLARVPGQLLHSWINRGFAPTGSWVPTPDHMLGRRGIHRTLLRFSICDVLKIVVQQTLCSRTAMCSMADAALIADMPVDHAIKSTAPAANTDGVRPNVAATSPRPRRARFSVSTRTCFAAHVPTGR
jgi:hypothetical protein